MTRRLNNGTSNIESTRHEAQFDGVQHSRVAPEEWLWQQAKRHGIERRRFMQLLSLGGAAAVLSACTVTLVDPAAVGSGEQNASPFFKDSTNLIVHGERTLETKLENLEGFVTPINRFFVRNNSTSVDIDVATWRLVIEGDAVAEPLELTYEDIRNLPSRTLFAYLECAGNQRNFFEAINGQPVDGTPWRTGGISNGEWTGVALRDVLELAGIQENAIDVLLIGLDTESPEGGFRRVLPVEKALHPDTLLAYALNGEPLPKDHGYPLRAIVPGWVGSSSIKWLGTIQVSAEKIWTRNNTESYVLIGEDYAPEGEALGKVVTTQTIKSALALPWPATLPPGTQRIQGFAHSPVGAIAKVEWSDDNGVTWQEAALVGPQIDYSWQRFEFWWDAEAGEHIILTRATDVEGNTQPDYVPFNAEGYLFNQPLPHPITVA